MRTLYNLNKFLIEKLGEKAQPTLLDAFNALSRAYGGTGKAKSKEEALEELAIVFVGPAEGVQIADNADDLYSPNICNLITVANVRKLDTSNITDMTNMFSGCYALTALDVSNFNTSEVTGMTNMFSGCYALTALDVSNFNTSEVTDMYSMFSGCYALTSLDVSNFNTDKVTNMSYMFLNCRALTALDVSNFNTDKVTNMSGMFSGCRTLTTLDVSNFNTSNITNMYSMFSGCYALTSLDLSNFNTSEVTDMSYMFLNCRALTTVKWPSDGKWASNDSITSFDISAAPLDTESVKGLVKALATKTSQASLQLNASAWEAAKAADSTLEATLAAKNWVVVTV